MIGQKTYRLLRSMGVSTIETLSHIPPNMMEQVLGKSGVIIWKKANGIDDSAVRPYSEHKSISSERTFQKDTIDVVQLRLIIISMVEKLAFQLRKKQKLTGCVTVKIRYSNFDTHTRQKHIPYTSFDHVLMQLATDLFKKLYQRRMLIRLIGVKFSDLVYGVQQLDLFEDSPEMVSLYQAMDKIRLRFGSQSIKRATSLHMIEKNNKITK
jgi:DNA polymerase-4